jgi:hypothetical protein
MFNFDLFNKSVDIVFVEIGKKCPLFFFNAGNLSNNEDRKMLIFTQSCSLVKGRKLNVKFLFYYLFTAIKNDISFKMCYFNRFIEITV